MSEELSDVCLVMARDICEKLVGKQYHDTDKASIAAFIYSCATRGALATAIFSEPLSPAMGEETGWVRVPKEPTREMWAAMGDVLVGYRNRHHDKVAGDLYRALLEAAPKENSNG